MPKLILSRAPVTLSSMIQSGEYAELIQPSLLSTLKRRFPQTLWVAVEARIDGELAGIALAEVFPLGQVAKIASYMIKEKFKEQGIGRQLLVFTQNLLVNEENIKGLELQYVQTAPETPALEKDLEALGWPPGRLSMIRCYFDAYAFNPSCIHYEFHLPPSMHFFSWKDLTLEDRAVIEQHVYQGRCLPFLSPLFDEELIDLETSFGLRKEGVVVGWNITGRPDPNTISYSKLHIDNELMQAGYGIQLIVHAIRQQKKLPIPNALFEINLDRIDPTWWRFVKKRLMPIASRIERVDRAVRLF